MSTFAQILSQYSRLSSVRYYEDPALSLAKRINIPITSTSTPDQIEASQEDPWSKSSKYALGWVYFCLVLLACTTLIRLYHVWGDKIRTALYKEGVSNLVNPVSPQAGMELASSGTAQSTFHFFPANKQLPPAAKRESSASDIRALNYCIAFSRWIFYRPIPVIKLGKIEVVPPPLGAIALVVLSLAFVILYCFLPKPLFYQSIRDGSPPLAIRAGMLAISMIPWIVALSMKANLVSVMTGIGHERLIVLHRWAGYICLCLSLVHIIPFYITPVWEDGALPIYRQFIKGNFYIYGSGIAALAPLVFLCVHSLPFLRDWMYELFAVLHGPISLIFLGMLFWHCNNFLTSWYYLYATLGIWLSSYLIRLFYLNFTNPFRLSWLIGEESAVTILPENAVKVTIPTQVKWKPGQYVYLRMPAIAMLENHPFTIASLCSDDFPSSYGEKYRDMTLVFRPFRGFTRKVLDTALLKGRFKTYRSLIDGPYGGMRRQMASFDQVIFFAGGSGITAIASHLLDLIKRMRDGKALTRTVKVVWALKRPETMEWFKEELRICREYAPPGSVHCHFYLTAAKRTSAYIGGVPPNFSGAVGKRDSTYIRQEAAGDKEREAELRRENEDGISALPEAHVIPARSFGLEVLPPATPSPAAPKSDDPTSDQQQSNFDFGFPSTPTMLQKNLVRFAFLPMQRADGWRTEYGRPDIPYMLKQSSKDFGRRTCVFVCGPPSMRVDVANSIARLQSLIMTDSTKDELFMHAENYAI